MMMKELCFKILPVFLLVLVHISWCSIINSCCHFQHLDHCQVFNVDGVPYCTQETKQGGRGRCPIEEGGKKKAVSAHITDIDVKYDIHYCFNLKGSNNGASCLQHRQYGFISLNVSFALGGPSLKGILFQVVSARTPLAPPSCHYVFLNGSLNYPDIIEDQRAKIFYFAGFDEVFEPNNKYFINVRTLPAPYDTSLDRVHNDSVLIPDCNHLPDDIYFCSKPTAATWVSNITTLLEDQGTVNVSYTINNDTTKFTDYEIKVLQLPGNETVYNRSVKNKKDYWDCDGQTCVMHDSFNVSAGSYYITVQANTKGLRSSQACLKDPYRSQFECRIAYSRKFVVEDTSTKPSVFTTIPTTVDDASADQPSLLFLVALIIVITAAVITCFGTFVCVWQIFKHRSSKKYIPAIDDVTVAGWDFEPRTLCREPIQGHEVLDTSVCGDLSTGDLTDCMSMGAISESVTGNHFSQYAYVQLRKTSPDANRQELAHTDRRLLDYHYLQSVEQELIHTDEGYSENGAPINWDDWHVKRHPADRQDSGISIAHHLNENLDDITTISDGSSLHDRGQYFNRGHLSLEHVNGVKYHAIPQSPLSELVTEKVTTV